MTITRPGIHILDNTTYPPQRHWWWQYRRAAALEYLPHIVTEPPRFPDLIPDGIHQHVKHPPNASAKYHR
ncbi:hypothetical protein [Xylella fastidiosa]|uniref:hypothetical protein n=1 Tax=Xylella fastidiosa TaxID=2371 RepID=UPI0011203EBD|nr:hypothetical protein [Xylella fastidiosa]